MRTKVFFELFEIFNERIQNTASVKNKNFTLVGSNSLRNNIL